MADPPVYTLADLRTWVTLTDALDANELVDLRMAMAERAAEK